MLELTKTQTTAGLTELRLVMPRDKADLIADALRSRPCACEGFGPARA